MRYPLRLLAAASSALILPIGLAAQAYVPTSLATTVGAGGAALDIAPDHTVVGIGLVAGQPMPVSWSPIGPTATVLPLLPGDNAGEARAIGPDGTVVGVSFEVVDLGHQLRIYPHPTAWFGGVAIELQTLVQSGATHLELIEATGVDGRGRIIGIARDPQQLAGRGFVLAPDGNLTDLGSLAGPGIGNSEAADANDRGMIVGSSTVAGGFDHAVMWEGGAIADLHDPAQIAGRTSEAFAIDESGRIVGSADFVGDLLDYRTATIWSAGVATNLGTLGGQTSNARAVNEHGHVVGESAMPLGSPSSPHAFLWRDGVLQDLNSLISAPGWILQSAYGITDDGVITGSGVSHGVRVPYTLRPNCNGTFEVYGVGCPGTGAFVPRLVGAGCPSAGGELTITTVNGRGGAQAAFLFGQGSGVVPFLGCDVQILPALPFSLPFTFGGATAVGGAGTFGFQGTMPAVTGGLTLQVFVLDSGAAQGLAGSNGLRLMP